MASDDALRRPGVLHVSLDQPRRLEVAQGTRPVVANDAKMRIFSQARCRAVHGCHKGAVMGFIGLVPGIRSVSVCSAEQKLHGHVCEAADVVLEVV